MIFRHWLAALLLLFSCTANATVAVMTWNVKRLGQNKGQSLELIAAVASQADIVALQDVSSEAAAFELRDRIQDYSGGSWSVLVSHPARGNDYSNLHAFIYRDMRVRYDGRAVLYFDLERQFSREPFSALFADRTEGRTFVLASAHVIRARRAKIISDEVKALRQYWDWLNKVYGGKTHIILAGAFNLPLEHEAWTGLQDVAKPLVRREPTTLGKAPGIRGQLLDNIWLGIGSALNVQSVSVMDYPRVLGIDHNKARENISEHLPVIAVLGQEPPKSGAALVPLGVNPFSDSGIDTAEP